MIRALLLAAVALFIIPAWAKKAEPGWQVVFNAYKMDFYADLGAMQIRPDNTRLVWVLSDSKQGVNSEGAHSNISLQEYDCARGAFRYLLLLSYAGRMGEGELLRIERYRPNESPYMKGSPIKTERICEYRT